MGEAPATTRRRLRFGLRSMLIAIAIVAVVMGWAARARQQRDAVAALISANPGATVLYDHQPAPRADGIAAQDRPRSWLGIDYFSNVAAIELFYATDSELRWVARFGSLSRLHLLRSVDVTDRGLSQLRSLGGLKKLVVSDALNVSDQGLEYLAELSSLEELTLDTGSLVTGAGILKLGSLRHLKRLDLACRCPEAASAIDELRRMLPHCQIRAPSDGEIL